MKREEQINLAQNFKAFGAVVGWAPARVKTVEMTAGNILAHDVPQLVEESTPLPSDRLRRLKPQIHGILRGIVNELAAAAQTLE